MVPLKVTDFAKKKKKKKFLRYLDLCYVNPACHKLKTFPLL